MPKILRTRYIPDETVDISGDRILFRDEELLVTEWKPIHPRKDIIGGASCAFLKEGMKVSRFIGADGKLRYWYVDIIDVQYDCDTDTYRLVDLLADVRIWPDARVEVVDLDELADALESKLITVSQAAQSLRTLDILLRAVDSGEMPRRAQEAIDLYGFNGSPAPERGA